MPFDAPVHHDFHTVDRHAPRTTVAVELGVGWWGDDGDGLAPALASTAGVTVAGQVVIGRGAGGYVVRAGSSGSPPGSCLASPRFASPRLARLSSVGPRSSR